jgi:hypothetical protein
MAWKSYLKPENSVVAGVGVMGLVYATYNISLGTMSQAQATDANHPVLESSRKKAGYTSFILVAGIGLIARDANIIILGSATIIGMELQYRHSIMADPQSGIMQPPGNEIYNPAGAVVPMYPDMQETG